MRRLLQDSDALALSLRSHIVAIAGIDRKSVV